MLVSIYLPKDFLSNCYLSFQCFTQVRSSSLNFFLDAREMAQVTRIKVFNLNFIAFGGFHTFQPGVKPIGSSNVTNTYTQFNNLQPSMGSIT